VSVEIPGSLKFDGNGLIPVIIQDRTSGDILMVAYANEEALAKTAETGIAHFWSRSRGKLWMKGETSGNVLNVVESWTDCDRDVLVLSAEPAGPACHTGARTCFGNEAMTSAGILAEIERTIADRAGAPPEMSYTARLLAKGLDGTLKKIGEEATELVIAAKSESVERVAEESADLIYHLMVVLAQRQVPMAAVLEVLRRRRRGRGEKS
jgi:phosphoribosyl-AMP cyclohydrolase / phosphoribosyl-ATP pyrophosphohydrolase